MIVVWGKIIFKFENLVICQDTRLANTPNCERYWQLGYVHAFWENFWIWKTQAFWLELKTDDKSNIHNLIVLMDRYKEVRQKHKKSCGYKNYLMVKVFIRFIVKSYSQVKPFYIFSNHISVSSKFFLISVLRKEVWNIFWTNVFILMLEANFPIVLYFICSQGYSGLVSVILTHLSPIFHIYTPWKRQKTKSFLTFSGGV